MPAEHLRGRPGAGGRGLRARPGGPLHPPHPPPVLGRPRRLPARVVHDEVQPQAVQRRGGPAGAGRRCTRRRRRRSIQGWLELLVDLEESLCRITGMAAATLQPPAGAAGELTGLLLVRAWHRDAGGGGAAPATGADPRLRPRHQPGVGHPRRLRGHPGPVRRPRPGRRGRAAGAPRRRRRRHHADQPQHPRPVRGGHRRDRRRRPRGGRAPLLRRRQPQRHPRGHPSGRHGLRHRAHEPAQDLRRAPRRRRPRRRPGGGHRAAGALPARAPAGADGRRVRLGAAGALDRPHPLVARQRPGPGPGLVLPHLPRLRRPAGGRRRRRPQRQLAAPPASRRRTTCPYDRPVHARVRGVGRRAEEAHRASGPSTWPSGSWRRASTRRRCTSR